MFYSPYVYFELDRINLFYDSRDELKKIGLKTTVKSGCQVAAELIPKQAQTETHQLYKKNLKPETGMGNNTIDRFHELRKIYDHLFGPGATLELKEKLGLGTGIFNDELTTKEVQVLNRELKKKLSDLRFKSEEGL